MATTESIPDLLTCRRFSSSKSQSTGFLANNTRESITRGSPYTLAIKKIKEQLQWRHRRSKKEPKCSFPEGIVMTQVQEFSPSVLIHKCSLPLTFNVSIQVATALSSTDCFILQSGSSIFTWHGNTSSFEQQQLAARTAEFLKPGVAPKLAKEGTESSTFWFALGGKQIYTSKKPPQDDARDPHLYTFSLYKGKFKVTEIFNFSQDDLLTEDMLILDTHAEIFVWVGQSVDPREKSKAFEIGQKYIELGASLEGLSQDVPLYKVTEGNEPCFFTTYFSWDSKKATIHGNSFEKKLLLLFGTPTHISKKHHRSNGSSQSGPTQRASAMAALNFAFNPSSVAKASAPRAVSSGQGSQRATAVAALSGVLTAEQKKAPEASPARFNRSSLSTEKKSESPYSKTQEKITRGGGNPTLENNEESPPVRHDAPAAEDGSIYSYEQLKAQSTNPARGIDLKRREAYLSDTEFQSVLRMTKEGFYQQPKWKQDLLKKKVDLF